MKSSIILIILFLSAHFTFGQIAGQIVEGKNYKGVIFPSEKKLNPKDTVTRWVPSELDIQNLELQLEKFIVKRNKKKLYYEGNGYPIISINLKKYIRQYVGYLSSKGEKIIYVNCFWYEKNDPFSKNWESRLIQVFDGGSYYWQIHYNVARKRFFSYSINGVA